MKTRIRRGWRSAGAAIASSAALFFGGPNGAEAQVTIGDIAPGFQLETVDGQLVSLSDFRDEKFVFLNIIGNT